MTQTTQVVIAHVERPRPEFLRDVINFNREHLIELVLQKYLISVPKLADLFIFSLGGIGDPYLVLFSFKYLELKLK